jgi:hypothetical protein
MSNNPELYTSFSDICVNFFMDPTPYVFYLAQLMVVSVTSLDHTYGADGVPTPATVNKGHSIVGLHIVLLHQLI